MTAKNSEFVCLIAPALELLLDFDQANSFWPKEVLNNETVRIQVEIRRNLATCLKRIFSMLPRADMKLSTGINDGFIDPSQATDMYNQLTAFLEESDNNKRMLLYLPFELIPESSWETSSLGLRMAISRFCEVYMRLWKDLLTHHDFRASFFDGDVLEPKIRIRPLEKVVKAAHLAPILVDKGLVSTFEIIQMIEESSDEILRNSLADAITVMFDMHLLDASTLDYMSKSQDRLVQNLAIIGKDNSRTQQLEKKQEPCSQNQLLELMLKIQREQASLEDKLLGLSDQVSVARINWLRQRDEMGILNKYAQKISTAFTSSQISLDDLKAFALF